MWDLIVSNHCHSIYFPVSQVKSRIISLCDSGIIPSEIRKYNDGLTCNET